MIHGSDNTALLDSEAVLPSHVVHRAFANETVVLNLESGKYHGLNPTAGRILETLEHANSVREAAAKLAIEYGLEPAVMESDVCDFIRDMLDRGLIELRVRGN